MFEPNIQIGIEKNRRGRHTLVRKDGLAYLAISIKYFVANRI
jgi:hypothetical protein